jgi:hypothetical protein
MPVKLKTDENLPESVATMLPAGTQTISELQSLARILLPLLDSHPLAGALWIIDEHRIRIRR